MRTNLLRGLLSFIIILFLSLNLTVISSEDFFLGLGVETVFASETGGIGAKEPNQKCFVGVRGTSGTKKYWCGDCQEHYVYQENGDGKCTRAINPN